MKLTIDETMIKDMLNSNDGFIVWRTKELIRHDILEDIREDLSKWHIPFTTDTKLYSAIFTAIDIAVIDETVDKYIQAQLDQEED